MSLQNQAQRAPNQCKDCSISHLCLPASIEKSLLTQIDKLSFKSYLLAPGEYLCRQGEVTNHLFAVRSGILKSYWVQDDGQEFVMGFHLPPDLFGWEGLDGEQRALSISALDYSNVCQIEIDDLKDLAQHVPEFHDQLFFLVSKRFRYYNNAVLKSSAGQRVAQFILNLNAHYKQIGYPENVVKLPMSHQEIANFLRITPETISRLFRSMQSYRIIKVSRKEIHVLDEKALMHVSENGLKKKKSKRKYPTT